MLRRVVRSPHVFNSAASLAQRHVSVTVAKGDGVGPEIMDSCLDILTAAKADIQPEYITGSVCPCRPFCPWPRRPDGFLRL